MKGSLNLILTVLALLVLISYEKASDSKIDPQRIKTEKTVGNQQDNRAVFTWAE